MRAVIRGLAAAALLGFITVGLAVAGVLVIVPVLVARRWRRRLHATHG
jgi:ABC-type Mn2+/Zn2+ transport system permease subunit